MLTYMQYANYVLIAASLAAAVLVTRAVARKFGSKRNIDMPRCAKCGHGLANMESTTCPECGTDVMATGVLRPGYRERPNLAALATWTIVCAIATTVAVLFFPLRIVSDGIEIPTFYWVYPIVLILWTVVSLRIVARKKKAGQLSVRLVTPPADE